MTKLLVHAFTLLVLSSIFNLAPTAINAAEEDKGFLIIDRKPWKISWVKENERTWILTANFEKGTLRTYFKKEPPEKNFGLSHDNKPYKQELEFYSGIKFESTDCQYEQWPDGAKAYAFKYEQKFERNGAKLELTTTGIIEEVGNAENEIRYAMYKIYE